MFEMYCDDCCMLVEFDMDDDSEQCNRCGGLCDNDWWHCENCGELKSGSETCSREGNCDECASLLEEGTYEEDN